MYVPICDTSNSLLTESMVDCDTLLGKELGPLNILWPSGNTNPRKMSKLGTCDLQKYNRENPVYLLFNRNSIPRKFPRIQYIVTISNIVVFILCYRFIASI